MATWADMRAYVHANYKAEDLEGGTIKLVFNAANLRTQLVFLVPGVLEGSEGWVTVSSPIADITQIDLARALSLTEEYLVGGLSKVGSMLVLVNSMPLANMDANELVRPMELVVLTADRLEHELTGSDRY